MRYWWVNQKQTYQHEVRGGYLWSPQRKANGTRNAFYESMREVAPGDIIFSFASGLIKAVGIAQSYCYPCPKPVEFGSAGMYWDKVGWRVDVRFTEEPYPIRPKAHMDVLRPLLPGRYAPLRPDGNGLQNLYLTELPKPFARALAGLMGRPILSLVDGPGVAEESGSGVGQQDTIEPQRQWDEEELRRIHTDPDLDETERETLVQARRGQGRFRQNVFVVEKCCRVTKVYRPEHLRASHTKPWRESSNDERLDGENGLLLTPSIDHLFDRGFITFDETGELLISPAAHRDSVARMGVDPESRHNVGRFTSGQRRYLAHHRDHVFLHRQVRG